MAYTPEQIKQGYCDKYNIKLSDWDRMLGIEEDRLNERRVELIAELDNLPTAEEKMKREGIEYLVDQSKTTILEANKDVEL